VTIGLTIPIALLMGIYLRWIRPGRVLEASAMGLIALVASLYIGRWASEVPSLATMFTLSGPTLAISIMIYSFAASVMPVWLLLAPRDYLSAFVKIAVVLALAAGILVTLPPLQMPALTQFVDGTGPVFAGKLFPFAFITIACGAISGFHALISSGTTPKMLEKETDARMIGYGAMLMESFVAVMALIAACALTPGVYFAINAPAGAIGTTAASAAEAVRHWGFTLDPAEMQQLASQVGETSLLSRTGGARLALEWPSSSPAHSAALPRWPSGITSPSCSRRCSFSPRSTPDARRPVHASRIWADICGAVRPRLVVSGRDHVERDHRRAVGTLPLSRRDRSTRRDQLTSGRYSESLISCWRRWRCAWRRRSSSRWAKRGSPS
jgi:hypothetical protein